MLLQPAYMGVHELVALLLALLLSAIKDKPASHAGKQQGETLLLLLQLTAAATSANAEPAPAA
jgi:hypothetical protein